MQQKKEFARVPIEEASIKILLKKRKLQEEVFINIFESKEDLLKYILKSKEESLDKYLKQKIVQETKGDIFQVYIDMFDYITKRMNSEDKNFFYNDF